MLPPPCILEPRMLLDSNNYTTGEPLSVLLSPFYLPSPELTPVGAENPFDASTAFSQMAESDSEPSLPSPSVAGNPLSPLACPIATDDAVRRRLLLRR